MRRMRIIPRQGSGYPKGFSPGAGNIGSVTDAKESTGRGATTTGSRARWIEFYCCEIIIMEKTEFMKIALEEARKADGREEIPVGAVIVREGRVIAASHNKNRMLKNPTRHAEIMAIEDAASFIGNERLTGCDMFVTKEPCAMCAGAIVHARIRKLYVGTRDARYGACGTVLSVCGNPALNHVPEIEFGILEDECSDILKEFFKGKR